MPKFQLVTRGDGRLGVVKRTLHGAGFLGSPGAGRNPFPQTNPFETEAGSTGTGARFQSRLLPGSETAADPIPFVGFSGAWTVPFGRTVAKAVGIELIPGLLPGRDVSPTNCRSMISV